MPWEIIQKPGKYRKIGLRLSFYPDVIRCLQHFTIKDVIFLVFSFKKHLKEESKRCEAQLEEIQAKLDFLPCGSISIRTRGDTYVVSNDNKKSPRYLKKTDKNMPKFATKKYLIDKKKEYVTELAYIHRLIKICEYDGDSVYDALPEKIKNFVTPLEDPTDVYVRKWKTKHSLFSNSMAIKEPFITINGEHVRSKTEKIIADRLFHENIPYVYEPVIQLDTGKKLYPDFIILNTSTREDFFFEHFGKMGDSKYSSDVVKKIRDYNNAGFHYGINFLYTFESLEYPFCEDEFLWLIDNYFK